MKIAIVFLCDQKFKIGLDVLFHSIKKRNNLDNIDKILFSDDIKEYRDFSIININKDIYKDIPITNQRFLKTYYKLECFRLNNYDRIIYIDTDMICLGNIKYLFSKELNEYNFYAALDNGIGLNKERINSGIFVINNPLLNEKTFNEMINLAIQGESYDGGDQGIINQYIFNKKIKIGILPMKYNVLKRIYKYHPKIWSEVREDIRMIHFVGQKPWEIKTKKLDMGYYKIEKYWLNEYKELYSLYERFIFFLKMIYEFIIRKIISE